METERITAENRHCSVREKGLDLCVWPHGLARKLRENIPCLFAAAAAVVAVAVPSSMFLAGYFFKIPQLMDWGFYVAMGEAVLSTNMIMWAWYSRKEN